MYTTVCVFVHVCCVSDLCRVKWWLEKEEEDRGEQERGGP